ncbi:MAG: pyridoxal-phosphate dependent enzyme [Cyclobacteriaceae bacterium]
MSIPHEHTPVEQLHSEFLSRYGVSVFVKRDDVNHPMIMGNKWRKLKYNLEQAKDQKCDTLLTYGGAYSNHVLATAAAAAAFGFKSIGVIRGDELNPDSNITLKTASDLNMKLEFVSREKFRKMKTQLSIPAGLSKVYVLPEGGTNKFAIKGCAELIHELGQEYDLIATSMGTGGTFAGLLMGLKGSGHLLGFSALKGPWINDETEKLLNEHQISYTNYGVYQDHYFGGYGKYTKTLIEFINAFYRDYHILLDPIYTGKMFFSVWEMIKNAQIATGSRILLIHTGGLQGIAGFNERHGLQLPGP